MVLLRHRRVSKSNTMEVIDQATLAALLASAVVLVNKVSAYVDRLAAKKNGGTVYDNVKKSQKEIERTQCQVDEIDKRLTVIESKMEDIKQDVADLETKLDRHHRELLEMREEMRLTFTQIKTYVETRGEM